MLCLDYRLAPEGPWPASVDDTVAALRWIASAPAEIEGLTGSVGVAGDSAGGCLAALAQCLRDEDRAAPPDLQALFYANTDLTGSQPSMRLNATGGGLDPDVVRWFNAQWVPDESRWGSPGVSPLAAENLAGLPPAYVVSAEHDPLRDELELYASRPRGAGVAVTMRREAGMPTTSSSTTRSPPPRRRRRSRRTGDRRGAADRGRPARHEKVVKGRPRFGLGASRVAASASRRGCWGRRRKA